MIHLAKTCDIMRSPYPNLLNIDQPHKTIVFERAGLVFIFNWHPTLSIPDYAFPVPEPGTYRIILCSDDEQFGGHQRLNTHLDYPAIPGPEGTGVARIYNINRALIVLKKYH